MIRPVLAALALCAALTSCAAADEPAPPAPPAAATTTHQPASLTYPAIGVDRQLLRPVGLDDEGAMDVPDVTDPSVVYLRWSARLAPGRPLILASHVNTRGQDGSAVPGVFAELADARRGDPVTVTDTAGQARTYRVTSVERFDKDEFPDAVYEPRPQPMVVLVTCVGDLETLPDGTRSYDSNEVVEAVAVS